MNEGTIQAFCFCLTKLFQYTPDFIERAEQAKACLYLCLLFDRVVKYIHLMLHGKNRKSIRFAALKILFQMLADIPNESQDLIDSLGYAVDLNAWVEAGITFKYAHDMTGTKFSSLF
jgi:hypothetical protein